VAVGNDVTLAGVSTMTRTTSEEGKVAHRGGCQVGTACERGALVHVLDDML
jgi:hypothetical protein